LKKVQTSQIIVTPNSNTKIKLDELNKILDEMQQGETAVKRLAEMDASRGMQDPAEVARRMRGDIPIAPGVVESDGILGDAMLAQQRVQQAQKMEAEARGLMAEANRLMTEAKTIDPALAQPIPVVPKKRGRPAKAKATA